VVNWLRVNVDRYFINKPSQLPLQTDLLVICKARSLHGFRQCHLNQSGIKVSGDPGLQLWGLTLHTPFLFHRPLSLVGV